MAHRAADPDHAQLVEPAPRPPGGLNAAVAGSSYLGRIPASGSRRRRGALRRPRSAVVAAAAVLLIAWLGACGSGILAGSSPSRPSPIVSLAAAGSPWAQASAAPSASATPTPFPTPTPTGMPPGSTPLPSFSPRAGVAELDTAKEARLQAALDRIRRVSRVPAVSAAVVFPDGTTWTGQAGTAVLSTGQAVSADTLFSVGSITKTFTATLVLRLVERGTLSLDDPLSRFVPEFPHATEITIRELMNHTSGIQDLFHATGVSEAIIADHDHVWTPSEVISRLGKPYFSPGHNYHYSNTNYVLLGVVIERATGETLATLLRSEFFDPLGMTDTYYQAEEQRPGSLSHGYMGSAAYPVDITAKSPMIPWVSETTAVGAAGAIASTPRDLARWASALYGGDLLRDSSLAAMTNVATTKPFGPLYPYGLGLEQYTICGNLAWGHRGHLDGYWSSMVYLPGEHLTVVLLTNAEWAKITKPTEELASIALGLDTKPSASPSTKASR